MVLSPSSFTRLSMKPGYMPDLNGLPYVPLTIVTNITSGTYAFSESFPSGTCVQISMLVRAILGAGVTSADLKLQQSLESPSTADWYDTPLLDVGGKTTVLGEFLVPCAPYVVSIATTNQRIGPIPFPLLLPFCRLAYKISGVGTANLSVAFARTIL